MLSRLVRAVHGCGISEAQAASAAASRRESVESNRGDLNSASDHGGRGQRTDHVQLREEEGSITISHHAALGTTLKG
jgi:hypothetical protein